MSRLVKWFKLFQNEWMKLIRKKSTLVMIGLLFFAVAVMGGILKWDSMKNPSQQSWEQTVQREVAQYSKTKQAVDPSSYQYERLEEQLQTSQYRLENDLPPVQKGSFWWFVEQSQNLISFITLFSIIAAAGIVATEFSTGTIKLLAIRPVSRWKILYSKYITTIVYGFFMLGLLFLFAVVIGAVLFPVESAVALNVTDNGIIESTPLWGYLQWYLYSFVGIVLFTTLAFMISTVFRSNALAIGITMFLMFTGSQVVFLLSRYEWAKYLLFAHTDFTQYITANIMMKGLSPTFSLSILAIYFIGFHVLSYITFTKRDIAV